MCSEWGVEQASMWRVEFGAAGASRIRAGCMEIRWGTGVRDQDDATVMGDKGMVLAT